MSPALLRCCQLHRYLGNEALLTVSLEKAINWQQLTCQQECIQLIASPWCRCPLLLGIISVTSQVAQLATLRPATTHIHLCGGWGNTCDAYQVLASSTSWRRSCPDGRGSIARLLPTRYGAKKAAAHFSSKGKQVVTRAWTHCYANRAHRNMQTHRRSARLDYRPIAHCTLTTTTCPFPAGCWWPPSGAISGRQIVSILAAYLPFTGWTHTGGKRGLSVGAS